MSEKKQVIHVKDLVIKADNVYVERSGRGRHHGPSFETGNEYDERESRESSDNRYDQRESEGGEERRRGPFDWF